MALLAETLVEEWLNRRGFFTVRGVRQGVWEMDLLAVRYRKDGKPEAWHVEVQASFRPVNYVTKLSKEWAKRLGKRREAAIKRTPEMERDAVSEWVQDKFHAPAKVERRNWFWADLDWRFVLVHGVARHRHELDLFPEFGVDLVPLENVLHDLCAGPRLTFRAAAGGDLADLIEFYEKQRRGEAPEALEAAEANEDADV